MSDECFRAAHGYVCLVGFLTSVDCRYGDFAFQYNGFTYSRVERSRYGRRPTGTTLGHIF